MLEHKYVGYCLLTKHYYFMRNEREFTMDLATGLPVAYANNSFILIRVTNGVIVTI